MVSIILRISFAKVVCICILLYRVSLILKHTHTNSLSLSYTHTCMHAHMHAHSWAQAQLLGEEREGTVFWKHHQQLIQTIEQLGSWTERNSVLAFEPSFEAEVRTISVTAPDPWLTRRSSADWPESEWRCASGANSKVNPTKCLQRTSRPPRQVICLLVTSLLGGLCE